MQIPPRSVQRSLFLLETSSQDAPVAEAPLGTVQRPSLLVEEGMLGGRVPSIRLQQQQRTSLSRRFRLLEDDLSTVLQDLLVHGVWQVLQIDLAHHLDTVGIQIEDLEVGVVVSVRDRWPVMIDGLPVSVSTAGGRLVGACLASPAVQVVEMMIRMMIQMMVMVMMVMMTRRTMTAMALALLTGLRQEILIDYYRTWKTAFYLENVQLRSPSMNIYICIFISFLFFFFYRERDKFGRINRFDKTRGMHASSTLISELFR